MANTEPSLSLPAAIKSGMRRDIDLQHPLVTACMRPKKNNIAQCDVCHIFFKQKKFLLEHRIKEHGHKPEWQCQVCDMVLCSKYNLNCHMDKHKDVKKHKCPACPASFNTRASQRRHYMYKHTEERPHRCSLCNFATVEHDKLLIHLRNHTGESPYKCDTCGMTFKTPISFKRHVVTHTGWRQYLCVLCLKKFGTPVTVKEHMFRTHGVTKNVLDKVRNVKTHGMPSLLAKFLLDMQLDDSETKMVNSLKYYEIQESVAEEIEISNLNYNMFEKEVGGNIVDKSPFFMLKSKDAVKLIPAKVDKTEYEDPSWADVESLNIKKTSGSKKRRSGGKKIKTEVDTASPNTEAKVAESATSCEEQDINNTGNNQAMDVSAEEDTETSDGVKAIGTELTTSDPGIGTRRGLKRKRSRKSEGKEETESITQNVETNDNSSVAHKEASVIPVNSQSSGTQEQEETEIKRTKMVAKTEVGQNSVSGTDTQESSRQRSDLDKHAAPGIELGQGATSGSPQAQCNEVGGSTADAVELEGAAKGTEDFGKIDNIDFEISANITAEDREQERESSESDEGETSETSMFVKQTRKTFSVKTPKLNSPVNENKGNKTATKTVSHDRRNSASTASNDQDIKALPNQAVDVADASGSKSIDDETVQEEEEIPLPTNFVSVVADVTKEGTGRDTCMTPVNDNESEASYESFDSSVLKDGPPKSLPPFISLERCSVEHKERLLVGMKRGAFGPTPSVVRVLEDGSMINVSNLYKAYLPPSSTC